MQTVPQAPKIPVTTNPLLEERALIARAKTTLMRRHNLSEPDAYRALRRRAMESRERIVDVAARLLGQPEREA